MFYPCLSVLAGMWLLMTPILWTELPARGVLAGVAGLAAMVLAIMGIASPKAQRGLAAIGLCLALANFVLPGGVDAIANFHVMSLALLAGGLAPGPRVVPALTVAAPVVAPAPQPVAAAPLSPPDRLAA